MRIGFFGAPAPARACAMALAVSLLCAPASAAPERWVATSTTAMAITGDVRFAPPLIVFANGRALHVERMPRPRGFPSAAMEFYRVAPPSNPALLNGNRLCGAQPPAYLVVSHARSRGGDVELSVYGGPHAPANEGQNLCATFFFQRARP